jgi:hypothetical protein
MQKKHSIHHLSFVALLALGACGAPESSTTAPSEDEIVDGRDGGKADRFLWFVDRSLSCSGRCGKIKWAITGYCGCDTACKKHGDCCTGWSAGCYDPCAEKKCGEACTRCAPQTSPHYDPGCKESMVLKACDKIGQCSSESVALDCSQPECTTDRDCPEAVAPGGHGFVHALCRSNQCVWP